MNSMAIITLLAAAWFIGAICGAAIYRRYR